ncbi:acetolactate synthase catalytic subunit [Geminicoccaceae bacterium 1502E]|nr:acetolactate synthase catalytic subunit [Geminicoccaceae bacterium 1502E]
MEPASAASPTRRNETVAMRLASAFRRHGVEVAFGQSLPSAFHLAAPEAGIRQAVYRAENAGGTMADGYARISNKVGVVTAQNGPAATLLVPPLAEALKVSVPLVALVQEVNRDQSDKNAFQELDHHALFASCAKWIRRIDHAGRIDDYVDLAFSTAVSGRPGPVVLLVPADLLNESVEGAESRSASLGRFPLDRMVPEACRIEEAARLLAEAEAPLVHAGGGVHLSQATAALAALQQDCHLPVATTTMGKGAVDETHPLSLGVIGYYMGKGGRTHELRSMVRRADVVLLVGNRTNQNGTDSWQLLPPGARYIHIDVDGQEIGRNYEAMRLVGDARATLAALREAMLRQDLARRAAARPAVEREIGAAVEGWRALTSGIRSDSRLPIRPERVMAELDARLTPETIVTADASYSSIWVCNYLTARAAGARFVTPRGLAGLGWGLPLAIGAQIAAPERRVVCVAGDGGFAHTWAELETLKREGLPICVIVLNNQILGYQKDAEDAKFGDHTKAVYFSPVDHAAIARACGCRGVRIESVEAIGPALDEAFASGEPTLLDIVTDPAARPPITSFEPHHPAPF